MVDQITNRVNLIKDLRQAQKSLENTCKQYGIDPDVLFMPEDDFEVLQEATDIFSIFSNFNL